MPISTDEVSMNKVTEKTHRILRVMGEVIGEHTIKGLRWAPRWGMGGRSWAGREGRRASGDRKE